MRSPLLLALLALAACTPQERADLVPPVILVAEYETPLEDGSRYARENTTVLVRDSRGNYHTEAGTPWARAISQSFNIGDTLP